MHRKVFIIVLAIALWPLCSESLTREDFLVHSTQDLVKLCSASESDPLYQAAIGFCSRLYGRRQSLLPGNHGGRWAEGIRVRP